MLDLLRPPPHRGPLIAAGAVALAAGLGLAELRIAGELTPGYHLFVLAAVVLNLPPLRRFILAGGSPGASALHVARAICRRAERAMVGLGSDALESELLIYVNRLSDLLFVMGRAANHRAGTPEVEW